MSLRDLTGWLKGADWDIEIGAITELAQHREDGPAVLFDEVKGYAAGYRLLVNSLGSLKRTALTLGLDTNVSSPMQLVQAWRQYSKKIMPIPAKTVDSGPVIDEDIDPTNTWDVLWAICTRSDPEKDIDVIRRMWSGPLDPIIPPGRRASTRGP